MPLNGRREKDKAKKAVILFACEGFLRRATLSTKIKSLEETLAEAWAKCPAVSSKILLAGRKSV